MTTSYWKIESDWPVPGSQWCEHSLRKQLIFRNAIAGFPEMTSEKRCQKIPYWWLITNQRSASDWLTASKICFFQSEHEHEHELGRDTPSIWEFLCLLIPRQTSGGITKCWLFSLVVHIITYCMLKLTWAIINCNHAIINWLEVNVHERTPQITDLAWTFFHGEWLAIHRRIDSCFKTSTWFMTSQGWDKYTWIQLLLKQNRFQNSTVTQNTDV